MRAADWLLIHDALDTMLDAVAPCDTEEVPLDDAAGRTLAEPIISPVDQPPWDNSAMDGYAARAEDVSGASAESPVVLRVIEDVAAGAQPLLSVTAGQATRIMTGAPIPAGADSVIRVEHTRRRGADHIEVVNDYGNKDVLRFAERPPCTLCQVFSPVSSNCRLGAHRFSTLSAGSGSAVSRRPPSRRSLSRSSA
jgi:molybdopterin biosynthesis enzyme